MILPALLFLCFFAGKPAELKVAEGSDVSLSCSSATGESHWLRHKPNTSLKLNTTEFLLIKNFQKQDEGYYDCNIGTHQHMFKLELKHGSTKEQLIFFRASEGDSVFFFCKALSAASLKAQWSWTSHTSSHSIGLNQNSHHFNNRLRFRENENDFSLEISPVQWNDSGKFSCNINSASKDQASVFELVLVKVSADPPGIMFGHSVRLKCELSSQNKDFRVLWMNTETRETFSNPLELKDVALSQQSWTCCVFNSSVLRAVFPLTLNITHAFTTTPPSPTPPSPTPPSPTHTEPETPTAHTTAAADNYTSNPDAEHGQSHTITTTIIIIGVFIIFILVVVFIAAFSTKTPEKRTESVTYAEVKFRKKSDASTEHQLNSTDVPAEEESEVLYATVRLS
ncbi:uncharacterized protein LOC113525426 isoform X2 [Pangasianodon hypophthalmus]|uniref:uncharacterized protein LOC113525426 isoform X2 n=1 Tax=Pangasianodon hypophthalmus TaxID=310915 RepID=UPI0023073D8A|nr:uncharacterized protein LOC113525426 isoform X2 [Pangasianodon hypophthalmus]